MVLGTTLNAFYASFDSGMHLKYFYNFYSSLTIDTNAKSLVLTRSNHLLIAIHTHLTTANEPLFLVKAEKKGPAIVWAKSLQGSYSSIFRLTYITENSLAEDPDTDGVYYLGTTVHDNVAAKKYVAWFRFEDDGTDIKLTNSGYFGHVNNYQKFALGFAFSTNRVYLMSG